MYICTIIIPLIFTFHYAKIKTQTQMSPFCGTKEFTFHYAKIKTQNVYIIYGAPCYLHSTKQRLKPSSTQLIKKVPWFTFHYAKIKTVQNDNIFLIFHIFTFHYAKIKTVLTTTAQAAHLNLHSTMQRLKLPDHHRIPAGDVIYIPLCKD